MSKAKRVAIHNIGCKLNYSEAWALITYFQEQNYKVVSSGEQADVYIINSCTVTSRADKKSRQAIRQAIAGNPNAIIIVTGCYSQLYYDKIAKIKGVDYIIGNSEKFDLKNIIQELKKQREAKILVSDIQDFVKFMGAESDGARTRCFLKIQDGCDYYCTYCTVPYARGKSRNDSIENIIKRCKKIVKNGYKEIVLTGVNIGDFGKSTNETFIELLRSLEKDVKIPRIRLSSIEPDLLTDEIIELIARSQKFMPHFHISLQSGSDKILKLMNRRYTSGFFKDRIEKIKTLIPDCCIAIDIITGFPGETEQDFLETYNFVRDIDISYFHVFPYSERSYTKSKDIYPKISSKEIKSRTERLLIMSSKKKRAFYEKNLGKQQLVLFEGYNKQGKILGFTPNYIRVEADYKKERENKILAVRLIKINKRGYVLAKFV